MQVLDWGGWGWPGWNALVGVGTLALACVAAWVSLREGKRTAEQRMYEQLLMAAANLRAVAAFAPMMRAGLVLEANPPPLVFSVLYRLRGRPWPMDASVIRGASRPLTLATSSLALVEPRLTAEGRVAAGAYRESQDALFANPENEKLLHDLINAANRLAAAIEVQPRQLM